MAIGDSCHVEGGGNNYAGSRCYNVLGVYGVQTMVDQSASRRKPDVITTPNTIRLDSVAGLEGVVSSTKHPYYSIRISANEDFIGRIMSINPADNTIVCDNLPLSSTSGVKFCGNRYDQLWLPDYPELGTYTLGYGSHAEGYYTKASQNGAHAEGSETMASGKYSHSEGLTTKAGYCAHAEGVNTQALGMYSHAAGTGVVTGEVLSDGRIQRHDNTYAWSGNPNKTYYSNGKGTFNVDPLSGINGFYIGNTCIGLKNQEFDLESGMGVLNALSTLIEKLGGKVKKNQ